MSIWRPSNRIRVKAIGVARRDGRLLAAEVRDDAGEVKGFRPLGGAVEFGEGWAKCIAREFAEELSLAVEILGDAVVFENLFVHEGVPGHEIVFAASIRLPDGALPGAGPVRFTEDGGEACVARWVDPAELDRSDGPALYPAGLMQRLGDLSEVRRPPPPRS